MTRREDFGESWDFAAVVAAQLPVLLRVAAAFTSADQAPDVVQDALLTAWAHRRDVDPQRGTPQAWLLGIVYNRARGRWRRRMPTLPLLESDGEHVCAAGPDGALADARVDLRRAIDALPARQRSTVVLHYYADLSVAEVATLLECSAGTVKSTLFDARRNLAARLGDSYART